MTAELHRHNHTHHLDPQQLAAIIKAINAAIPEQPAAEEHECPEPEPAVTGGGDVLFLDTDDRVRRITPEQATEAPPTWRRLYTR